MKKLIASIATAALLIAMSTTAFAATITEVPGSQNVEVKGKYEGSISTPDVYSVDVTWGTMEFTYNAGGTIEWDETKHQYNDKSTKTWSPAGNTVTVINHSNKPVTATLSFAPLATLTDLAGTFDKTSLPLPTAVGKELTDASLKGVSTLTLSGSIPEDKTTLTKIGTITITLA